MDIESTRSDQQAKPRQKQPGSPPSIWQVFDHTTHVACEEPCSGEIVVRRVLLHRLKVIETILHQGSGVDRGLRNGRGKRSLTDRGLRGGDAHGLEPSTDLCLPKSPGGWQHFRWQCGGTRDRGSAGH